MGIDQISLLQFQKSFPDDAACAAFVLKLRWPEGFVCPRCGGRRAALLRSRAHTYDCLDCGRQTSVTAGTVMHRSKLPLTTWFWAARLLTIYGTGLSASQLAGQLGVSYRTAWLVLQKLRRSMLELELQLLNGIVEMEHIELSRRTKSRPVTPENAEPIIVIGALEVNGGPADSAPAAAVPENRAGTGFGRIRLAILPDISASAVAAFVRVNVAPGATLVTAGGSVRRAFLLLKRWGLGTLARRRPRHSERDLRELALRFNSQFHRVSFEAILGLAALQKPATYWDIVGRANPHKEQPTNRRRPRRRRTAQGMRQDRRAATRRR